MSGEETQSEHVIDDTAVDKPAQEDTYFVDKTGKPFTGETQPEEEQDAEAKPAEPAAKPAEKAKEKPKSKGQQFEEARQATKAARAAEAAALAKQQELEAKAAELEELKRLALTDPRGFIRKNGHDLRSILEAELAETDATPEQKAAKLEAQERATIKAELEQVKADLRESRMAEVKAQEVPLLRDHIKSVAEDYPRLAALADGNIVGRMWDAYRRATEAGNSPTVAQLLQTWEDDLADIGVQPPQPAVTPRARAKNEALAKRKGAVRTAGHAEEETDDDTDGGASETGPATLTNRMASERRTNGRSRFDRAGKEAHLGNAISLLRDSDN